MIMPSEFIETLDDMVSPEVNNRLIAEFTEAHGKPNLYDVVNLVERGRVITIKERISSTHSWEQAVCVNDNGARFNYFWCATCNMICSEFEHTNCISIISKVKDKKPTYTSHNQYLMFTCNEIMNMRPISTIEYKHCFTCGVPERGFGFYCSKVG